MYETIYANNPLYLTLPDDTFNQNMTRILEIKRKNIAHLLGLTEHEDLANPNPQKNLLKKLFFVYKQGKKVYNNLKILFEDLSMQQNHAMNAYFDELVKAVVDIVKIDSTRQPAEEGFPFGKGVGECLHFFLNLLVSNLRLVCLCSNCGIDI
mgnify:CR=1 FL=1